MPFNNKGTRVKIRHAYPNGDAKNSGGFSSRTEHFRDELEKILVSQQQNNLRRSHYKVRSSVLQNMRMADLEGE
jgi:hypothetical protein